MAASPTPTASLSFSSAATFFSSSPFSASVLSALAWSSSPSCLSCSFVSFSLWICPPESESLSFAASASASSSINFSKASFRSLSPFVSEDSGTGGTGFAAISPGSFSALTFSTFTSKGFEPECPSSCSPVPGWDCSVCSWSDSSFSSSSCSSSDRTGGSTVQVLFISKSCFTLLLLLSPTYHFGVRQCLGQNGTESSQECSESESIAP